MTDLTIDMVENISPSPKKRGRETDASESDQLTPRGRDAGARADERRGRLSDLLARLSRGQAPQPAGVEAPACGPRRFPVPPRIPHIDGSALERCVEASLSTSFVPDGEGGFHGIAQAAIGRPYRIECTPVSDAAARVTIDTGYRVRSGRIRAANKLAMAVNGILRVRGFSRIGHDGAVRFSFVAPCDDPSLFDRYLCMGLSSCEEALAPFCLVSTGASVKKAFKAFVEGDEPDED